MPDYTDMIFSKVQKIIEESEPQLWRTCCPRLYRNADKFSSPRVPAVSLATALVGARGAQLPMIERTDRDLYFASELLIEKQVPTFFIEQELLHAVALTAPPDNLRWDELNLPFEAAVLMLPAGFVRFPDDTPVHYIAYARIKGMQAIPNTVNRAPKDLQLKDNTFIYFTANPVTGVAYERTLNASKTGLIGTDEAVFQTNGSEEVEYTPLLTSREGTFMQTIHNLLFRLLLGVTARPEFVEYGKRDGLHKKSQTELWTPNIIGRGFRYKRTTNDADNASSNGKRMHWRKGHYRNQAFGTGRQEHKIIWLEPVFVAGKTS